MARDLNRLFDDIRRSRDVFVTQDGRIEDAQEAQDNEKDERRETGASRPRVNLKPEVFAAESERGAPLSVSLSALAAIHAEASRYPGETGGIVVGPRTRCITEFIPSGSQAERTRSSYVLDPAHLQPLLDDATNRGLAFLGIWHSHPVGVPELSGTDRDTAARMLGDRDYGLAELVLPLSVRTKRGFETRFFIIKKEGGAVVQPEVVVVSGESPPAPTGKPVEALPWDFVATAAGGRRLKNEQDALARCGFATRARRTKLGMAFLVSKGPLDIAFLFPPEYPLAPPVVEARCLNERVELPLSVKRAVRNWSSRSELLELARAIERAGNTADTPQAQSVLTRLGQALGFAAKGDA